MQLKCPTAQTAVSLKIKPQTANTKIWQKPSNQASSQHVAGDDSREQAVEMEGGKLKTMINQRSKAGNVEQELMSSDSSYQTIVAAESSVLSSSSNIWHITALNVFYCVKKKTIILKYLLLLFTNSENKHLINSGLLMHFK